MKCKLKDFCTVINGRAYSQKELLDKGKYRVLRVGNFFSSDRWYFSDLELSAEKYCNKGDLLFAWACSFGPRIWDGEDRTIFHYHIWKLDIDSAIVDKKYLYYLLKISVDSMTAGTHGSVMMHITKSDMENFEFDIPTLEVQKKIAAILSALDEKIAINRAINENLYHSLSLSFKNDYWDKAIDHSEWVMTTLDETTSRFGTGLNPRKNFVLGHGNNYYVTIKNMGNNRIYLDDRCDKIDDEAIRKIQMRSDLKVGDLLFSGIGTIGRVFLIDKPATNWNTSESVFNLRPNAKVSSEFLYLLLLNNDMQDYAISLASGSVQKGIRMADLKKYSFFLPTSDVIKRLTSLWKPLIKQIKANEVESDSLAVLRDTLLPKLMSGEIDVSAVKL